MRCVFGALAGVRGTKRPGATLRHTYDRLSRALGSTQVLKSRQSYVALWLHAELDEASESRPPSTLRWPLISNARPGDGRQIGSEVLVSRMGKAYRPWVFRHLRPRPLGLTPFQWQRIKNTPPRTRNRSARSATGRFEQDRITLRSSNSTTTPAAMTADREGPWEGSANREGVDRSAGPARCLVGPHTTR